MTPKNPTPAAGVPVPQDDEDWETSGVIDTPVRAPTNNPAPDQAKATARKALAQISDLKKNFDKFEERQYERDRAMLERFDDHAREDRTLFAKLGDKMDEQSKVLSNIGSQNASQSVELKQIRHDLQNQRMVEVEAKKAEISVKAVREETDITDTANQKKFRRDLVLKVIGILGPIFAALGGGIALLLRGC